MRSLRSSRRRRVLSTLAVLAALAPVGPPVVATPPAAAATLPAPTTAVPVGPVPTTFTPPAFDPFYADPPGLAALAPGTIVRARRVAVRISEWGRDVPVSSWQVAYRSSTSPTRPVTAVTTILVPSVTWTGPGPRPVIAYQTAEDSTGSQCAPSYTMATNDPTLTGQEHAYLAQALDRGIALAIADHEGPDSAFLAGPQAGRIVLDGVRAARRFGAAGLSTRTPFGLWGLSGGAFDTAWAGELAGSYAPELRFAGIAFGGAPADLGHALRRLDGGPFVGFALGAMVGLHHGYPGWDLPAQLNARGREVYAKVDDRCTKDFVLTTAFTRFGDLTDRPDFLALPQNASLLRRVSLGQRPPRAPVYDYYAGLDQAVSEADTLALVDRYCGWGVPVVPREYPLAEHVTLGTVGAADAVSFLADRFLGRPLTGACP